jgi:hypothetical protein
MDHDDAKHIAGFAGIMAVGMVCMYLFVKLFALASYLDRV